MDRVGRGDRLRALKQKSMENRFTGRCARPRQCPVTANAIAHQLPLWWCKQGSLFRCEAAVQCSVEFPGVDGRLTSPFTSEELAQAIKLLKCGKAQGPDNIPPEFLNWVRSFVRQFRSQQRGWLPTGAPYGHFGRKMLRWCALTRVISTSATEKKSCHLYNRTHMFGLAMTGTVLSNQGPSNLVLIMFVRRVVVYVVIAVT